MIPLTAVLTSESKVIDARIREVAEQHAREAGMSLREWLGQIIMQDAVRGWDGPPGGSIDALAIAPSAQALARAIAGLETAERAHMAAVDRFSDMVNAVCADSWPEVADEPSAAPASAGDLEVAEATSADAAIAEAAEESAELEAEVGTFLTGLLTHVDGLRMEIAAKVEANAARRLDRVGRTLEEMRNYIEAAEQELDGSSGMLEGDDVSAAAVKQLAAEVARFIAVVDARFQRTDVAGAGQMSELRGEIAMRIDELVARIADCERRVGPTDADIDGGPAATTALQSSEDMTFDFTELAHDAVDDYAELEYADEGLAEEELAQETVTPRLTLVASDGVAEAAPESLDTPEWSPPPARRRRSLFGWRGSLPTESRRARTSNTGSALIALSLGAMLGLVTGGYLATPPGTLSAAPARVLAALGLSEARPLPLRTREAPTFAVVTVSPKPSR
jgi:hypothetical protein